MLNIQNVTFNIIRRPETTDVEHSKCHFQHH